MRAAGFAVACVVALGQDRLVLSDSKQAAALEARYREMTRSWIKEVRFSAAEKSAMEHGRQYDREMDAALEDVMAGRVLALGEPSWDTVTRFYPGKVLDRTILGAFSDSRRDQPAGAGPDDEFSVWWNCAISSDIIRHRVPATVLTVAYNTTTTLGVGKDAEMLGVERESYSGLQYEGGFLPILRATYSRFGVVYRVTIVHAPVDDALMRVEIENPSPEPREAWLHETLTTLLGGEIRESGQLIRVAEGTVLAHSDLDARFDAAKRRVTHRIALAGSETKSIYFRIPYKPGLVAIPDRFDFERTHRAESRFWMNLLAKGTQIEVPEERVNRIWKALLIQNFLMADGPRFTYGSGLRYNDSYYPFEDAFATHVLAMYGHREYALGLLPMAFETSVTRAAAGRKYQNRRAMPMHHMLALYRLTGDKAAYEKYRIPLLRIAEEIVRERKTTMVEANGVRPLHWGWLPPDRPGVDLRASTQEVYCPAHNITNCQGLQDLGEFLQVSGANPQLGKRYTEEARAYRDDILAALERTAIRVPGRPPFVDLQTLYFKDTPDYGPDPYDHLANGRLQGAYSGYWTDMQMQFNFFNPKDTVANWLADYVEQRGGRIFGITRARRRPNDADGWINSVYNSGIHLFRLRQGRVEQFLLGFYGRLAYAMTRNLYVASEGAPFIGYNTRDGGFVDASHSFPNSASNSETLHMLRAMLVHEELRDNRPLGQLHLLRGAPKAWLAPGKRIKVESAPTFLGTVSFKAEGLLDGVSIEVLGKHPALHIHTRRKLGRVVIDGREVTPLDADGGVILVPPGESTVHVRAGH
jgi:hypothetical protein